MMDKQDRVRELCLQIRSENDLQRLTEKISEVDDILGSVLSEVDRAMRSMNERLGESLTPTRTISLTLATKGG